MMSIQSPPITYVDILNKHFAGWAASCSWDAKKLRQASEHAIRHSHHQAVIAHEAHRARGRQPDIWTLDIGSVQVIYTVESHGPHQRAALLHAWIRCVLDACFFLPPAGGKYNASEWRFTR